MALKRSAVPLVGRVNLEKLARTTDDDIRRHAQEDGDDADEVHQDWYPTPAALREKLGRTQVEIAMDIRVPVATWRNWEQGRVQPDPAARSLLVLLWRVPGALKALRGS